MAHSLRAQTLTNRLLSAGDAHYSKFYNTAYLEKKGIKKNNNKKNSSPSDDFKTLGKNSDLNSSNQGWW